MRITTYRELKGVWNGSPYPIIWYYDPTKHNNVSFKKSIPYDAVEKDEIYEEFFGEKKFAEYMYGNVRGALQKICKDRKLQKKLDNMKKLIDLAPLKNTTYINNSKLELHCVAVCYNKKGEILIVQRCNKDLLPQKWEFGCAKASYKAELTETIESEYKDDFNLSIKVHTDNGRDDVQPVPLAVYTINKKDELHKGIIFVAEILEGDIELNDKKHINYRFVKEEDIEELEKEGLEFVPDAIDTMKKAFRMIKEIQNGKKA